ncbi:hypothetical protein ACQ4M3_41925 [Leptolyngbya sp. AN03gr2]|uniref:hypothetical protein n=1 Tax=unclassified Leptolyngbya TaxID=2650499 RepID=UPI003D320865
MELANGATDLDLIGNEENEAIEETTPNRTVQPLCDLHQQLKDIVSTGRELIAFGERHSDLTDSIFPTKRCSDTVFPVYPGNSYNPDTQKLTIKGLNELVEVVEKKSKFVTLDGYKSDNPSGRIASDGITRLYHEVENPVGACIKHRERKTISFDFDCAVFSDTDLPEAAIVWITRRTGGAIVSRGNRNRLAVSFRQSEELKEYLQTLTSKSKLTYQLLPEEEQETTTIPKIEISLNDGASQNFWGEHKSGSQYQVIFPEVLVELTVTDFEELTACLTANGWTQQKQSDQSEGRIAIDNLVESNEYKKLVNAIRVLAKEKTPISIAPLLSPESREIALGNRRYHNETDWTKTDPKNYSLPKGTRRHTEWRLFTDLAWAVTMLEEFGVVYSAEEVENYIRLLDDAIVQDTEWVKDHVYMGAFIPGTMRECYGKRLDEANCREAFVYSSSKQLLELLADAIDTDEAHQIAEVAINEYRSDWLVSARTIDLDSSEWTQLVDRFVKKKKPSECNITIDENTISGTDYFRFEIWTVLTELARTFPEITLEPSFYLDNITELYTPIRCVRERAITAAIGLLTLANKADVSEDSEKTKKPFATDDLDIDELLGLNDAAEPTTIDTEENAARQRREEEFIRTACVESVAIFPQYVREFLAEMLGSDFWGVTGQMTVGVSVATAPVWNKQSCAGFVVNIYGKMIGAKGAGKNISAKPATNLSATVTVLGKSIPYSYVLFLQNVTGENGKLKPPSNYTPVPSLKEYGTVSLEQYRNFFNKNRNANVWDIQDRTFRFQFGGKKGTWAGTRDAIVITEKNEKMLRPLGIDYTVNIYRRTDRAWAIDEAGVFAKDVAADDPNKATITSDILREGRDGSQSASVKANGQIEVIDIVPNVAYWTTTADVIDMLFVRSNPNHLTNYAVNGSASRFFYPMGNRVNSAETKSSSDNFKYLMLAALWFGDQIEGIASMKRKYVKDEFTVTPVQKAKINTLIRKLNEETIPEIERFTGCKLKGLMDTDKTRQLILSSAPAFQRTAWLLKYALLYWKTLLTEFLELTEDEIKYLDSNHPLDDHGWFGMGKFLEIENVRRVDPFPGSKQVEKWQIEGEGNSGLVEIYQRGVIGDDDTWLKVIQPAMEKGTIFNKLVETEDEDCVVETVLVITGEKIEPLNTELEDVFVDEAIKFVQGTFAYYAVVALEALEDLTIEQKVKTIKTQREYNEIAEQSELLSEAVARIATELTPIPKSLGEITRTWRSSKRKELNLTKENPELKGWQVTIVNELKKLFAADVDDDGKLSVQKKPTKAEIKRLTGYKLR